jgi:hypothetical protein
LIGPAIALFGSCVPGMPPGPGYPCYLRHNGVNASQFE